MKVYQFGLLAPTVGESIVRQQLRAAHEYRNELVAIERGRRSALRAIYDPCDEVREAIEVVRAATRTDLRAALHALNAARKTVRDGAPEELTRISALDASIRRDARALTPCHWGTYLDVEARHQQSRAQPLYEDDGVTSNDPTFQRGPRWRGAFTEADPRLDWWLHTGQVGVQLQKGLTTRDALGGGDRRVRLELGPPTRRGRRFGTLWIRVGSQGRDPIWAAWPIKTHRDIPSLGIWKWVRVSVHPEGLHERWTVEITVDVPSSSMSPTLRGHGTVAIEWEWSPIENVGIRVARWCDDAGASGQFVLPERVRTGITKSNGIRAVRDLVFNQARDSLSRLLSACDRTVLPSSVLVAMPTLHLWKSSQRLRALAMAWRLQREGLSAGALGSAVGATFDAIDTWEKRDAHLYDYEACARGEALRERRELYRLLAAQWRRRYRTVLLSDQDLSREARWGDDSDVRFVAGIHELRQSLRHAFGDDAVDCLWRDKPVEDDERPWCERTRDAWMAGGARGDGRFADLRVKQGNAWAARKAKKTARLSTVEAARKPTCNPAEGEVS